MSIRGRAVHTRLTSFSVGARLQSRLLPSAPGDLVFIGDGLSLHGEWAEWFPTSSVRTLGDELLLIDDARELVTRVPSPRALVLLVGSADLLGMGGSASPARAATRLEALVRLAKGHIDPASIFVVGVPIRPAFGDRAADFNRRAASVLQATGVTFVPAPTSGGHIADGYMVSALRWDGTVYSQLAEEIASATGLVAARGRAISVVSDVGSGPDVKMERKRSQLFSALPPPKGRVVLFGDSITEGGFWDGWLPGVPVANRGISADTVAQLAARVDSAIDSPLLVSVLAGTNDLVLGDPKDADSIGERFHDLIGQIRDRAATVPIVINSIMPRGKKYAETILAINAHYRDTALKFNAHYLDLWPALATPAKTLRKELTPDGLHMNGNGYREWVSVLRPTLEQVLDREADGT